MTKFCSYLQILALVRSMNSRNKEKCKKIYVCLNSSKKEPHSFRILHKYCSKMQYLWRIRNRYNNILKDPSNIEKNAGETKCYYEFYCHHETNIIVQTPINARHWDSQCSLASRSLSTLSVWRRSFQYSGQLFKMWKWVRTRRSNKSAHRINYSGIDRTNPTTHYRRKSTFYSVEC